MNLDCIAQVLINASLATALGVDLFEHHIPESATEGLLMKLPMDGIKVNHYVDGFYRGRFQIILRSKSHADGDIKAPLINAALTFRERTFIDSNGHLLMNILQCLPTTLPVVYPRSAGNVYEWSCNFEAQYFMPATTTPGPNAGVLAAQGRAAPIVVPVS